MKHIQLRLFSDQEGDEFLYQKPGSDSENTRTHPQKSKDLRTPNIFRNRGDSVFRYNPEIPSWKAFMAYALSQVESWTKFCALAIKANVSDSAEEHFEALSKTGRIIKEICHKQGGFLGVPEPDMMGCFFPEKDHLGGLEIAKNILVQVDDLGSIQVTIGVATWPLLSFKKKDALTNAIKALDHAAFMGPSSAVCFDAISLNISGDNLFQKGDIAGAIEEFEMALRLAPDNINIQNSLGVCYGVKEDHGKALAVFETVMQLDPNDIMAVYNAGMVLLKMQNQEQALKHFLAAEAINENHFEIAFQTGRLFLDMKQYENARTYLEKAARLAPESGPAQRFLGECYVGLNLVEKAIRAYSNAVKLNPSDAASLSSLGFLYIEKGENQEIAQLFCRQSVYLSPQTGLFRHRLGKVYLKCQRFEDALAEFKQAVELGHDSGKYIEEIENRTGFGI